MPWGHGAQVGDEPGARATDARSERSHQEERPILSKLVKFNPVTENHPQSLHVG